MTTLAPLHVKVDFGADIPHFVQARALFAFEQSLRDIAKQETGNRLWIEVFKATKGDDSKLRVAMTPEQRKAL